ncbi:hypothetical protein B2G71_05790 [Novosphingobium sp. PC22D]|uniref:OmpW/AlkL family protein n=1 Tax=Novosphingobium sp. PC22D TaxID=1962403 RepID=UPI000BF066D3|nr:OmpW family outer membrane protein [Novosphingobium sp. PC22D]PEQ13821.1 hypothetical protein B2G71_05790 [Novosphingobium sp. PC22D]
MHKTMLLAAALATTAFSTPALAGNPDGKVQVKLLATSVDVSGKLEDVKTDLIGLPAGTSTKANTNVVPTAAIEYFFNKNFSVETICCFTQHHINGTGPLEGARIINHVLVLPATVTAKLHLDAGPIKPYVGAGPALFLIFGEKPGPDAKALGATSLKLRNELGVAVQAGVDVPLGDQGFGLSLDAKKYWIDSQLRVKAGDTTVLDSKHKLDPWVLSAGVSYRF